MSFTSSAVSILTPTFSAEFMAGKSDEKTNDWIPMSAKRSPVSSVTVVKVALGSENTIQHVEDDWDTDPENARNWSAGKKWTAVCIVRRPPFAFCWVS